LDLQYFKAKGVSSNGSSANPIGPVVIGGSETLGHILEQARARGRSRIRRTGFLVRQYSSPRDRG
jgi:hypothetical protein